MKKYDILQLQKLSTIELTSIAESNSVQIQNNFRQSLIYAILDKQHRDSLPASESNSRTRYQVADQIMQNQER